MKKFTLLLLLLTVFACRENSHATRKPATDQAVTAESLSARYPLAFLEVLDAHGGLERWKSQRALRFDIPEGDSREVHTIDLYSRRDRIDAPGFSMGFDGQDVWLLDRDGSYEGNAIFYHNLMFYFYAMPFVLADEGIQYSKADELTFDGVTYPGIGIRYEAGVGSSPKDEYYLYFDPQTREMAWLGYTVTYFSNAPSSDIHWIRYDHWQDVNGLKLPESVSWYNYEDGVPTDKRSTLNFENVSLSEAAPVGSFFDLPEGAKVVEAGE